MYDTGFCTSIEMKSSWVQIHDVAILSTAECNKASRYMIPPRRRIIMLSDPYK